VSVEVRWTPAEVFSIHGAGLRELEADPRAPYVPGIERDCAMAECDRPAEGPPLVVNIATMPGPFAVDLCSPCREPFACGMEAIDRLAAGDHEVRPHSYDRRHAVQLEARAMTTIIPGPGQDGWAMRDDESAAEALGYPPVPRERSDEDDERQYLGNHPSELERLLTEEADAAIPLISQAESYALHLGARALAEVAAGLAGPGEYDLAAESARSAAELDELQRRSTVAEVRGPEPEAER
jgi:hypothetical protein